MEFKIGQVEITVHAANIVLGVFNLDIVFPVKDKKVVINVRKNPSDMREFSLDVDLVKDEGGF